MQLNLPLGATVVFLIATGFILIANAIFLAMLIEVNAKLPKDQQVGLLFVNLKFFRVVQLHRELFPNSSKPRLLYLSAGIGIALIFGIFIFARASQTLALGGMTD